MIPVYKLATLLEACAAMRGESMCCVLVPMEWKNVRELLTLQIIIIIIFIIDDWSKYEIGIRLIW